MLDLNSTEWANIESSPGGNGLLTAELLAQLWSGDDDALPELYQQVCHQNSIGETAYVAVPHLVAIARRSANLQLKAWLLEIVGSIVASAKCYPRDAPPIRDEWREEFELACAEACKLAGEQLQKPKLDPQDSFSLISALAGLHGHANLALLMQGGQNLYCPNCGEDIQYG
jgi:hypothetical protein